MAVGGQRHVPAALPPGNTRYPLRRRLGGPQGRSGHVWKMSLLPGFDPRTVQSLYRLCYAGPQYMYIGYVQGDTKKWELMKNPTKIEEIQEKKSIDRN